MSTETEAITLSEEEVTALARRMIAMHAAAEWLYWDEVPELSEDTFEQLAEAVRSEATALIAGCDRQDRATDIDSRYLWEKAS